MYRTLCILRTRCGLGRTKTTALVVSSTSWTPDEDFGILLDALILYDAVASKEQRGAFPRSYDILYPNLLVVVTGKGPQRAHYEKRMKHLKLNRVVLRTAVAGERGLPKVARRIGPRGEFIFYFLCIGN